MKRDRNAKEEELKESLGSNLLERNVYLENLIKILTTISEHTVLALDGKWGSGKTFFIKQLEYLTKNPKDYPDITLSSIEKFNKYYSIFYFNAWENDNMPPTESILLRMSEELWTKREKISNDILGVAKGLIDIPIKYFSGGSTSIKDFKNTYISQYIEHAANTANAGTAINDILYNYRANTHKKILFIIDDLDRCNPTFAVRLLESMKHTFMSDDAIFLVCANNDQLQHTIKKYYGEGFNGYEYLDRFYDMVINLPEPDIERYVKYELNPGDCNYIYNVIAIDIAKNERMSLRQVNRYISDIILLRNFLESRNLRYKEYYDVLVKSIFIPIATALKIIDIKKYEDFVSGNGEYIIDEYVEKSDEIRQYVNPQYNGDLPIKDFYKEIFNPHSQYSSIGDTFKKAATSIGFSATIDD